MVLATCASGSRNHNEFVDVTGVFQILLDHGFALMLRRDNSVASLVSSMGEVRQTARVVTIVVFIQRAINLSDYRVVNISHFS